MAFNSVFGGGGMGGMGGRGGGGGREEEEGNNLQRRVEELEARLQLLEFVGGAAGCLAVLGSLLAALRVRRVARFRTVSAERFLLVRPPGGALARDALVGELRSVPPAAAAAAAAAAGGAASDARAQTELRLFDGMVSLHDAHGTLRYRVSADGVTAGSGGAATATSGDGGSAADEVGVAIGSADAEDADPQAVPEDAEAADSLKLRPLRGKAPSAFAAPPPSSARGGGGNSGTPPRMA